MKLLFLLACIQVTILSVLAQPTRPDPQQIRPDNTAPSVSVTLAASGASVIRRDRALLCPAQDTANCELGWVYVNAKGEFRVNVPTSSRPRVGLIRYCNSPNTGCMGPITTGQREFTIPRSTFIPESVQIFINGIFCSINPDQTSAIQLCAVTTITGARILPDLVQPWDLGTAVIEVRYWY